VSRFLAARTRVKRNTYTTLLILTYSFQYVTQVCAVNLFTGVRISRILGSSPYSTPESLVYLG
jgi:hypothetical protein